MFIIKIALNFSVYHPCKILLVSWVISRSTDFFLLFGKMIFPLKVLGSKSLGIDIDFDSILNGSD